MEAHLIQIGEQRLITTFSAHNEFNTMPFMVSFNTVPSLVL